MDTMLYKLDSFEGPLDLLLHLITKNKVSIYDIPIVEITAQYLEAIEGIEESQLENTSEFLVMAAQLLYIKSKMLLPKTEEEEEEDPRDDLARRLAEYQQYKEASAELRKSEFWSRYMFFKEEEKIEKKKEEHKYENLDVTKLYSAFMTVLEKTQRRAPPPKSNFTGIVGREPVSVKEKAGSLIHKLRKSKKLRFEDVFEEAKHKNEVVAIFLAILELMKLNQILAYEENEKIIIRLGDNVNENTEEILQNIGGDLNE